MDRKYVWAASLAAIGGYFALGYYFKSSFVEDVPRRDDLVLITRVLPTATPGTYFAHLWLPEHVTSVLIYENGIPIGPANAIYDDPNRSYSSGGHRWKFVEFNSKGAHVRRYLVFCSKLHC